MKNFSNRYMLLYSLGIAAIVALILTVVSVSLKSRQEHNKEAESKQMILKTIGIDASRDDAIDLFEKHVEEETLCDGSVCYLFDGGIIIPLSGNGLWGPIWGYLALDSTMTVVGAVFDHQGETPGLGAEIATDKFAQQFIGKRMDIEPIRLKKNADPNSPYEVDAISGSTMTSNGINEMLNVAYHWYETTIKSAGADRKEDNQ